jgi:hypothetical protein
MNAVYLASASILLLVLSLLEFNSRTVSLVYYIVIMLLCGVILLRIVRHHYFKLIGFLSIGVLLIAAALALIQIISFK